jgi:O-glycosyl hydrolase
MKKAVFSCLLNLMPRQSAVIAVLAGLWFIFSTPSDAAIVTINGTQTYQIIDGFGVNANHRSWTNSELQPAIDALIDQAGMTLFRVIFDKTDWESTNDNTNSDVMNWSYYNSIYGAPKFEKLWGLMGYLNQRGITNGLTLNFQGNGPAWLGGTNLTPGLENEWAEMITSLLVYGRNTRHLQFTLVGPENEPENGPDAVQGIQVVNSTQYITMMHQLALMLDANGLGDMRFVAPDLANGDYSGTSGTNWLAQIMSDPVIMAKLAYFGEHSYLAGGGNSIGVDNFLQQSAYPDRRFWMTEFNVWCSSCENGSGGATDWASFRGAAEYLLAHLANGASAGFIWEGYDSYYLIHDIWSYWGLLKVDNINAVPKTYTPRKTFYTIAQISKFVRPGSHRIAVNGSVSPLVLLAFNHPDTGQITLTGVNTSGSTVSLSGTLTNLAPISSLALYYTSSTTNLAFKTNVIVTSGVFTTTVPADCVFTLSGFPPRLAVSPMFTNGIQNLILSWPGALTNYALESATNFNLSSWSVVTNSPQFGGFQQSVILAPSGQRQFFRLHQKN